MRVLAPDPAVLEAADFWETYRDQVRHQQQTMPVFSQAPLVLKERVRNLFLYCYARALRPFLHRVRRHLTLLFLPPYSPQLSTIERVWKLTRRLATHNRYFQTLPAVLDAVTACFRRWQQPNETLRRLCCII